MARGVNKVILIGNLGDNPKVSYMANQKAVANISLATSSSYIDKQTGEKVEKTEWHRVVFFARLAEIVGEFLKKGSRIFVDGYLRTRKWQDKETGIDRFTTEIIAVEMQMLDSRKDEKNNEDSQAEAFNPHIKEQEEYHKKIEEDDIPF